MNFIFGIPFFNKRFGIIAAETPVVCLLRVIFAVINSPARKPCVKLTGSVPGGGSRAYGHAVNIIALFDIMLLYIAGICSPVRQMIVYTLFIAPAEHTVHKDYGVFAFIAHCITPHILKQTFAVFDCFHSIGAVSIGTH